MVTIRDVAERAGVNASTVSRALKDSSAISKKTKEKVKKAMAELGYVPNLAAKMLASGLTHSIGVVFPPMTTRDTKSQPFHMEILTEINHTAKVHGYTISIATGESTEDLKNQIHHMYLERRVDGFILLYSFKNDPVQAHLLANKIPFVMVGTPVQDENETTYIDNDNQLMAKTAVQYLQEKGHEQILFVTDNLDGEVQKARYAGYLSGLEMLNLPSHQALIFDRSRAETVAQLVQTVEEKQATAFVVIDDMLSLRVSQLLSFYQLKVPDDISIISFNNSAYAKIIHPYLTTFDVNIAALGRTAFTRIFEKVQTKVDENAKVTVPFTLKERESVRNRL
ncbi:LacI family DNA-binding transcriptional regulator [Streptococcus merionis]|uniref:LacI family transcriptional repressor n=1 Tax=Streptococcus merionis TaxID=400065 RepID=A0A239SVE3_9STRE|nr:LacI family DNA-binding transcriptional regulator [Streptococcus merionis]SNU89202.1 LacI family transcriptional repressor [Streptococcus merionis]